MKHTALFRLEHTSHAAIDTSALEAGLRTHLRFGKLQVVWMRTAGRTQIYIATRGCEGCGYQRCEPGCYADLLCRLLRAALPAVRIIPVSRGLAARPYLNTLLAWPRTQAMLPNIQILNVWTDARLSLHWSHSPKHAPPLTACLLTGGDGPEPGEMFEDLGWRTLVLPRACTTYLSAQAFPGAFWLGTPWPGALLPAIIPRAPMHSQSEIQTQMSDSSQSS